MPLYAGTSLHQSPRGGISNGVCGFCPRGAQRLQLPPRFLPPGPGARPAVPAPSSMSQPHSSLSDSGPFKGTVSLQGREGRHARGGPAGEGTLGVLGATGEQLPPPTLTRAQWRWRASACREGRSLWVPQSHCPPGRNPRASSDLLCCPHLPSRPVGTGHHPAPVLVLALAPAPSPGSWGRRKPPQVWSPEPLPRLTSLPPGRTGLPLLTVVSCPLLGLRVTQVPPAGLVAPVTTHNCLARLPTTNASHVRAGTVAWLVHCPRPGS